MTGAQAMLWQAGGLCAVFVLCVAVVAFAPAHAGRHEWRRGMMTVEEGALAAGVHAITLTAPLIDLAGYGVHTTDDEHELLAEFARSSGQSHYVDNMGASWPVDCTCGGVIDAPCLICDPPTAPLIDLAIPPTLPCPTPRPYVDVDDPPTVPIVAARVELSTWWWALPAADNERTPIFREAHRESRG